MEGMGQVEEDFMTILGALLCIQLADDGLVTMATLAYDVPYSLSIRFKRGHVWTSCFKDCRVTSSCSIRAIFQNTSLCHKLMVKIIVLVMVIIV